MQTKICTKCGIQKPIDKFYLSQYVCRDGTRGRLSECNTCKNKRVHQSCLRHPDRLRAKSKRYYNKTRFHVAWRVSGTITPEQITTALFTGHCDICGIPEIECRTRLHLDHDHETGEFRGWLCDYCNHAAGKVRNSPEIALKLAKYLEKHAP